MNFTDIWNLHRDHLFNFVSERTRCSEEAEDVLQEVAVKFHRALKEKRIRKYGPWLFRVARNTIADFYRKESENRVVAGTEMPDVQYEPAGNACVCDLSGFVIQHYLPEKYAQVLLMSDIEQIPQKEIASKMNLSLTATKSRIQRARKLLRMRIEECVEIAYKQDGSVDDFNLKKGCTLPPELLREMERLNLSL